MAIRNVTLVGASGNLGGPILEALVAAGRFRVTVLRRASSKSVPAHAGDGTGGTVRVVDVPDAWATEDLARALAGEEAVVACFPLRDVAEHLRLAEAAAAAGSVRRFIPADFGSCDSRSPRARELVPLFENKVRVRERLEALAAARPGFTWTSIVGGHFFDWGLERGFLHLYLDRRRADVLDDGEARSSLSTLARLAEAVVRVLEPQREAATANRLLFVQSFCVSQNEVLRSLEKATGAEWEVQRFASEDFIAKHKALADAGDKEAVEDLVFALGAIDGNWEGRPEFAMELLGLENEDLDEAVARVVAKNKSA